MKLIAALGTELVRSEWVCGGEESFVFTLLK